MERPLKKLHLRRETIRTGLRAGYQHFSANDGDPMGHRPGSAIPPVDASGIRLPAGATPASNVVPVPQFGEQPTDKG